MNKIGLKIEPWSTSYLIASFESQQTVSVLIDQTSHITLHVLHNSIVSLVKLYAV